MDNKVTRLLQFCGLVCLCLATHTQRLRDVVPSDVINLENVYATRRITFCNDTGRPSPQNIIVTNGTVYVGATNAILQIATNNFAVQSDFDTGPGNDSVHCNGPHFCSGGILCTETPHCVDNYNKILLADRGVAIACGSAHRTCDLLSLGNVSQAYTTDTDLKCGAPKDSVVTVRNPSVNLVAAVYANTSRNPGAQDEDLLYVGTAEKCQPDSFQVGSSYVDAQCLITSIKTYLAPRAGAEHLNLVDDTKRYIQFGPASSTSFVYMWSTSTHLFTIRRLHSGAGVTKISRTCHKPFDSFRRTPQHTGLGLTSYVESELKCTLNGVTFTNGTAAQYKKEKLFVLFSHAASGQQALCAVTLSEMNSHLNDVRRNCYKGPLNPMAQIITKDGKVENCSKTIQASNTEIECYFETSLISHLDNGGISSRVAKALDGVVLFDSNKFGHLSTFVVTTVGNTTVAFAGSTSGRVLKAHSSNSRTVVSETVRVSSHPILNGMRTVESGQYVVGITVREVFRVKVENCAAMSSCGDCLSSQDPYCGWCIQQSSCTTRQMCQSHWLAAELNRSSCPSVSTFQPHQIQINVASEIRLVFGGTPLIARASPFTCRFSRNEPGSGIFNYSSPLKDYPANPSCSFAPASYSALAPSAGKDHANVTLTVEYQGKVMAESQHLLTVYDCRTIPSLNNQSMCSSCVDSPWSCVWCVRSETCTNDACVAGTPRVTAADGCPTVVGFADEPTQLVPYGTEKLFIFNTTNLDPTLNGEKEFQCAFESCGRITRSSSNVNINSMTVECTALPDLISCPAERYEVKIFLQRDNYIIDSPKPPTAIVYNCAKRSGNCGTCLQFREQFADCRWCNSTSKCTTAGQCTQAESVTGIAQCGAPVIVSISPLNGPVEGGTDVTIRGMNLGAVASDIVNVTVGGLPCALDEQQYIPATTVVCKTSASGAPVSARLVVQTNYSKSAYSIDRFQYMVVDASSVSPTEVINGAEITVQGSALNVGNRAQMIVNGTAVPCSARTETSLTCSSPPVATPGTYAATVAVDSYRKTLTYLLHYFPLPTVARQANIFSFTSGGRVAEIQLSGVRGVQTASLRIQNAQDQACGINRTSSVVSCATPEEPRSPVKRRRRSNSPSPAAQRVYNVSLVINNAQVIPVGTVRYQNNPQLTSITELPCKGATTASNGNDGNSSTASAVDMVTIQIQGSGFDHGNSKKTDYIVTLDPSNAVSVPCYVSFVESTSLFCRASANDLKQYENSKLTIAVSSGNWSGEVTDVMYCKGTSNVYIIVIVVVVAIFALVSLATLCYFQRRVKKQKLEQKLILSKLDDLENKTRETARNAYYELQVGYMTNLTDNLSDRITYLPTASYFTQTLFNTTAGHPVLDKAALQRMTDNGKTEALSEWLRLIKNRDFLITFIRTLEEQRRFTVQDKGSVASFLTACLLSDLPYYTRIMFELLSYLIEKHVAKNPKLLLRRSESVVEKMVSHWLSITLYDECIVRSAGKPIFLLTKAIHYLVSSTPCDVIANKAMNSLNEMTLLGSEVSYETVTLHASVNDGISERMTSTVDVKVVNVDTITQAKTKIIEAVYRDRPYSECPKPDDLEFVMLSASDRSEGIVLSDIDKTSAQDGHFTKLNTLKHYNVPGKAIVLLRPPGDDMSDEDGSERGGFEQFLDRNYSFDIHLPDSSRTSQDSKSPLLATERRTLYHLIHPRDDESANGGLELEEDNTGKKANARIDILMNRPFQEIYLTRMVKAKTTLQEYVESVFSAILCPKPLPKSVRYFFQFLDGEAAKHKVSEPEVIHIWKTNSLLLRYWVNVLKNPEFLFDTNKTAIVDSCLNVITQAFMDACTTTNRKLGHDSPSNKLLYAKDAENYKVMVKEFYVNVSNTERMSEEEMNEVLRSRSKEYGGQLNDLVAAQMLSSYLIKYREQVTESLRDNEMPHFAKAVEGICQKLNDDSWSTTMV